MRAIARSTNSTDEICRDCSCAKLSFAVKKSKARPPSLLRPVVAASDIAAAVVPIEKLKARLLGSIRMISKQIGGMLRSNDATQNFGSSTYSHGIPSKAAPDPIHVANGAFSPDRRLLPV
jgi:hypothetical protein